MDKDLLEASILNVKKRILSMANSCGGNTHIGGSLSMVELLTVLYKEVLQYDCCNPEWADRDRFILSKGHCVLAFYSVLAECGIIGSDVLQTFQTNGSDLSAHPVMNLKYGIESSNGSLGQGVSMAVGIAKAAKIRNKSYKVYTLVGNGECNEGAVWEAAMLASQWKLDNLVVILDNNHMQSDGESSSIIDSSAYREKWESFGFDALEIDGHDIEDIFAAYAQKAAGRPRIIIANTIKGHGVSFMENNNEWHHNRLTNKYFEQACAELEKTV